MKLTDFADLHRDLSRDEFLNRHPMAALIQLGPIESTRVHSLSGRKNPWLIGRHSSADVRIAHPDVSSRHAEISRTEDGGFELIDLDSTNGTWFNSDRLLSYDPITVDDGGEFALGPVRLQLMTAANLHAYLRSIDLGGDRPRERVRLTISGLPPVQLEIGRRVVLGRSASHADVILPSDAISRRHCAVEIGEDGVTVQDLGSANGTWIDGAEIGSELRRLDWGRSFRVGRFHLSFEPIQRDADGELPDDDLAEDAREATRQPHGGESRPTVRLSRKALLGQLRGEARGARRATRVTRSPTAGIQARLFTELDGTMRAFAPSRSRSRRELDLCNGLDVLHELLLTKAPVDFVIRGPAQVLDGETGAEILDSHELAEHLSMLNVRRLVVHRGLQKTDLESLARLTVQRDPRLGPLRLTEVLAERLPAVDLVVDDPGDASGDDALAGIATHITRLMEPLATPAGAQSLEEFWSDLHPAWHLEPRDWSTRHERAAEFVAHPLGLDRKDLVDRFRSGHADLLANEGVELLTRAQSGEDAAAIDGPLGELWIAFLEDSLERRDFERVFEILRRLRAGSPSLPKSVIKRMHRRASLDALTRGLRDGPPPDEDQLNSLRALLDQLGRRLLPEFLRAVARHTELLEIDGLHGIVKEIAARRSGRRTAASLATLLISLEPRHRGHAAADLRADPDPDARRAITTLLLKRPHPAALSQEYARLLDTLRAISQRRSFEIAREILSRDRAAGPRRAAAKEWLALNEASS